MGLLWVWGCGGTSGLMRAGMLANSGLEAKAVRLSTASMRGPVAALHRSLFSWLKAPSRACTRSHESDVFIHTHTHTHPRSERCTSGPV